MNIAIIGCGLIGQKRAKFLGEHHLIVTADPIVQKAERLARQYNGAKATPSWQEAAASPDAEVAIVATTPDNLAKVTRACLESGKHVLVDKPAGRSPEELEEVLAIARTNGKKVRVGFNHRYHPAIQKAHRFVKGGEIGPLMYVRGRYGHGGRLGYEKEWRADPQIGGGGELLDQGMHLIDLSRWFLGDFVRVDGYVRTYFWNMPVEDNGFMMLRTSRNQVAWLHVSWTEWKNLFSFEIFGRDGKLQIDGLGGSYGVEQLTLYKMGPEMGIPETTIWQFPGEDNSWDVEFREFIGDIVQGRDAKPDLEDAQQALKIVHKVYEGMVTRS
jgi:predicted dehydrogenase